MAHSHQTDTMLQLTGVHLCCQGCVDAVTDAVESVPDAACECDMDRGTVTLTAPDEATAQKALDAIAAAGFHGDTGDPRLAMKNARGIPAGKVQRLTVSNIHNCCVPCHEAIKGAIESVEGVTGDTSQPKKTAFEVTGDFSAAKLVQALHAAGFHATVRG